VSFLFVNALTTDFGMKHKGTPKQPGY
jgi:hypothetical protein